ncbi:PilN domain-containing protein [Rhizobium rhizosphaerae]|nr:PilN domain-containing protein [Xaviernesmea rhizosphaerae]
MSKLVSRLLQPFSALLGAFVAVMEPLVAALAPGIRWIAVETADDDLAFYRVSRRAAVFVGKGGALPEPVRRALRRRSADVELRLRAESVIAAQLKVPVEAKGFAAQIIESRLDRLTPWNPERLLFGFALARQAGSDGQVTVDVVATAREIVAGGIARLLPFGVAPARVGSAAEPVDQPLRVDLFKGENDRARKGRRRRIAAASLILLAASLAFLAATAMVATVSTRKLAEADTALGALRHRLVGASGNSAARQDDLAALAAKTPQTASFVLIDRIATILPDNTFLDALEITPDAIRLAGSSTEAPALIPLLEAQPGLSRASFAAPVTRQADGRDRFDITVSRDGGATRNVASPEVSAPGVAASQGAVP